MQFLKNFFTFVLLPLFLLQCSIGQDSTGHVINENDRTLIRDRDGRDFDVTHAVNQYGMDPHKFYFGIGVGTIPSVDNPIISDQGPSNPSTTVFGVVHNGESRAYGRSDISNNEVFNEAFPGDSNTHVSVAYWPLFDLAAVYSRTIDAKILRLAPSGWTYDAGQGKSRSLFVLMDKETESLWFPFPGTKGLRGISGVYKDKLLKEFAILKAQTWQEWKTQNPTSKFVTE